MQLDLIHCVDQLMNPRTVFPLYARGPLSPTSRSIFPRVDQLDLLPVKARLLVLNGLNVHISSLRPRFAVRPIGPTSARFARGLILELRAWISLARSYGIYIPTRTWAMGPPFVARKVHIPGRAMMIFRCTYRLHHGPLLSVILRYARESRTNRTIRSRTIFPPHHDPYFSARGSISTSA